MMANVQVFSRKERCDKDARRERRELNDKPNIEPSGSRRIMIVDDNEDAAEILAEAAVPEIPVTGADLQASQFDHARDQRKHEPV